MTNFTKKCKICNVEKLLTEYRKFHAKCRNCFNAKRRTEYKQNPSTVRAQNKKFRQNNAEKIAKSKLEYYLCNKDKEDARVKAWNIANKDKVLARHRAYKKRKRKEDPLFKIKHNMRERLRWAFKAQSCDRTVSAIKDVGCTVQELFSHIEKQFQPGMSWKNYGKWHIDHIIPLSAFDLTKREEALKATHYTNLQPLWAKDNLKKGGIRKKKSSTIAP